MLRNLILLRKLYFGFSVLAALLLILMGVAFMSFRELAGANRWNVHTYRVLMETRGMGEGLLNIDTGVRGFAITDDRRFLQPVTKGRTEFPRYWSAVQRLTLDNPPQQERLHKIQEEYQQWLKFYVEPMLAMRNSSSDDAASLKKIRLISQRGKFHTDKMRGLLAAIEQTESELLQRRSRQADRLQAWTATILLTGGAFAIALSAALCVLLTGNTRRLTETNSKLAGEITDRKQAEEKLQATARQLEEANQANQRIMEYSPDVICTIDEAGRFLQVSFASEKLWGYTPTELAGRPYIEMVHPEDVPQTNQAALDTLSGQATSNFENRYIRKNGVPTPMVWSAVWSADNKIMFCVARDNTERKQTEVAIRYAVREAERARKEAEQSQAEAEHANAAKSEFLSRTSHELRTPMNAILGFAQLLEMDDLEAGQRQGVEQILKGGRHLLELINEVLDIARIEAGQFPLSSEPVHLSELAGEAIALVQPLAAERHIRFENSITTGYVMADQQRLKQVLLNLLSNAVKYNREGGLVRLSSGTAAVPGRVRFEVTDSGAGISPAGLGKLFAPFERLDAPEKGVEGTGIGLTISQQLVRLMDGEIGVYSIESEGSTFWVELPGAHDPLHSLKRSEATAPVVAETAHETEYTILYIEDNLSNLNLIKHILARRVEIHLLAAMQGRRGLELALKHRPDLILLDLHLPDMTGDEVLQHLRAEVETRDIPIVMLSADATLHQIERLRAAGAAEYLTKPLDVKQFLRVIEQTLGKDTDKSCGKKISKTRGF